MTVSPTAEKTPKKIWGVSSNVFFLGLGSFLNDVSSEMIFTLVPIFLANVLGVKTTIIGLVGGLSDSIDVFFRLLSGWFSDKVRRRKPLAVTGYSISTLVKPLMYIASSWAAVLVIRFLDRVGKGVRTSPRDALLADSAGKEERGRAFGLHRAMDSGGAVVGLAAAALIIYLVQGETLQLGLKTYQWLVIIGTIPAVLAVLVLLALVKEKKMAAPTTGGTAPALKLLDGFDKRFKIYLAVMAVFTLGNSSEFFVVLRAQDLGSSVLMVTLMLVLFNITYTIVSLPAGILSDRLGRRRVVVLGWFIYTLVYLGFAAVSSLWLIWSLFAVYGVYHGLVEGVARAFVADLVPAERRGTAYGLYHSVVGLILLPASLIAGWLWDNISPAMPFYFGAGLAFLAMLGMLTLVREH